MKELATSNLAAAEIVDIYDENFAHLGQLDRNEAHAQGAWHRAVHCWVVRPNDGGSLLFQLRSPHTSYFPSKLDISAAGHCVAGEGDEGVIREVVEELGISVKRTDLVDLGIKVDVGRCGNIVNREFSRVFLTERQETIRDFRPEPREVHGLFEIPIKAGLALFSEEIPTLSIKGLLLDQRGDRWLETEMIVSQEHFVPRVDPYYFRVFILAQRYLAGERYLAI